MKPSPLRNELMAELAKGPLTTMSASEALRISRRVAKNFLCRMVQDGAVTAERIAGSPSYMEYSLVGEWQSKQDARRKGLLKKYPLHNVRDPLVAFLFGPAQQQNGELTK